MDEGLSKEELQLLARLEVQNRILESDNKSLNSLTSAGHSRRSSDTSQLSLADDGTTPTLPHNGSMDPAEEEESWEAWGKLVNDWDNISKKRPEYIKEMVAKGVPQHFRGIVWPLLAGAHNVAARDKYLHYLKQPCVCERIIAKDLPRTFPNHEYFKDRNGQGQESLFNVLKAYSIHDPVVGFCQGMPFIAGLLLLQMPEEEAFATLVALMENYKLKRIYQPMMTDLGVYFYQLEAMVEEQMPELGRHFKAQNLLANMYSTHWFCTLFASVFPLPLVCRIMDMFLIEGIDFIIRVSIAILQLCKEDLLQLEMDRLIPYLQHELPSNCDHDPDYLIKLACQVKINPKKMKKLEKEFLALKAKEQEDQVELRRLRSENKLLRQRIDNLEKESSALANCLIQGQVSKAQEVEDNFTIRQELEALRQQEEFTQQELGEAHRRIQELHESTSQPPSLDSQTQDILMTVQEELVAVKLREAEAQEVIKELKQRVEDLEGANKVLQETSPDSSISTLQEELAAVKLREAEANLVLKELRQNVIDLQIAWTNYLDRHKDRKKGDLQEELMTAKLREADAVAQLKELRQRVMQQESQYQVSLNQMKRQSEEISKLKARCEEAEQREAELQAQLKEERHKLADLETKTKAETVLARIKEAENTQALVELQQKVSALEIKKQELLTARQLTGADSEEVKELQDRLADLQAEVIRLETLNKKLSLALAAHHLGASESLNGTWLCDS